MNPSFSRFSPHKAQLCLSYAISLTPQYGDAFFEVEIREKRLHTLKDVEDIWYSVAPYEDRERHYNSSRYYLLNLHAFFHGHHTVEIRGFNSTLHAGKVRAYITLALALNHQALTQKSVVAKVRPAKKSNTRMYLRRIGINDKVVLDHLTEGFTSEEVAA